MRQMPVEHGKADLRCVRLVRELRLGGEGAADRNAIAAAGELALLVPDLEGMHVAGVEQLGIGAHDLRRDPGEVPAPRAAAGASGDDALEVAVEGDGVVALPHLPAQPLGEMRLAEEQQRALRRRPPFQRRDMGERIEPAPVGGEHGRRREFVHDAGEARRVVQRAFGVGQGVVGRQQLVEAHAREVGDAGDALGLSAQASPSAQRSAMSRKTFAEQRGAPVGFGRDWRGKGQVVGVNVQKRPQTCGNGEYFASSLTPGLMEGYLNSSKSGVVNRSLTPP